MGNAFLMWQGGSASLPITETTEYELLADIEVTGTKKHVYINGLSIGKGDEVVLVGTISNASGSGSDYHLFCNNNVVNTGYYYQQLYANGTSVSSERVNSAKFSYCNNNSSSLFIANIKLTNNGYFVVQSHTNFDYYVPSNVGVFDWYDTSTFTMNAITSLQITSAVASAIGIGSRFQLYRATGEVTQTWVTV